MRVFSGKCHAQITISQEQRMYVMAENAEEAKEMLDEAFRAAMDEQYGWADINTVNVEEVYEC